jgi:hypothetical protein
MENVLLCLREQEKCTGEHISYNSYKIVVGITNLALVCYDDDK